MNVEELIDKLRNESASFRIELTSKMMRLYAWKMNSRFEMIVTNSRAIVLADELEVIEYENGRNREVS